jgi:hypothetical protein
MSGYSNEEKRDEAGLLIEKAMNAAAPEGTPPWRINTLIKKLKIFPPRRASERP